MMYSSTLTFFNSKSCLSREFFQIIFSRKRKTSYAHNRNKKLTIVEKPRALKLLEENIHVNRKALELHND